MKYRKKPHLNLTPPLVDGVAILLKQSQVIARFELGDLSANEALSLINSYSKMYEGINEQKRKITAAKIEDLPSARTELANLYVMAANDEISSSQLGAMLKPLQLLINSFDKSIVSNVNQVISQVQATDDSNYVFKAIDGVSEKLRNLAKQNDHLKAEWKILAHQRPPWSEKDQERLESRIARGRFIAIRKVEEKEKKEPDPFDTNY